MSKHRKPRTTATRMSLALAVAIATAAVPLAPACAADKTARIGVLSDMSGPYSDVGGPNGLLAVTMAVEDSGLRGKGWTIDVLSGDHQNRADTGASLTRGWIDNDRVDAVVTTGNSAVALAASNIVRDKNAVLLNSGAAALEMTGKACSPNTVSFAFDTYMLSHGTGLAMTRAGGDSWYLITADYAFGLAMQHDLADVITTSGGRVLGGARHPIGTQDFSSFLLQAQASGAKVVGLANGGADTINAIKQAAEFGIVARGQKLAALLLLINDVHAIGLPTAQGLSLTASFYWDLNDDTRAWSRRFAARARNNVMPSMAVAGNYAVVLHYLRSLEALGDNPHDGVKVVTEMKAIPAVDKLYGESQVRADGRRMMPAYLFQVKSPGESHYPWDYYKLVATIPAVDAALPLDRSECPLLHK